MTPELSRIHRKFDRFEFFTAEIDERAVDGVALNRKAHLHGLRASAGAAKGHAHTRTLPKVDDGIVPDRIDPDIERRELPADPDRVDGKAVEGARDALFLRLETVADQDHAPDGIIFSQLLERSDHLCRARRPE